MKLSDLLKESWTVKDGNVLSNGKLIGYYDFDRDSDSFWVDDVKKGKGQLSFETKKEVEDYFKKNEKDAVKHLQKLRESISEAQMHAQTQRESLKAIYQLKIDLKNDKDIMKLLAQIENKIKAYEPR